MARDQIRLSLERYEKLIEWIRSHIEELQSEGPTKEQVADMASKALGFGVTPSHVVRCRDEVRGCRWHIRGTCGSSRKSLQLELDDLKEQIASTMDRLEKLEELAGISSRGKLFARKI